MSLFGKQVHLYPLLEFTTKWYHMILAFVSLHWLRSSLLPSLLLDMVWCHPLYAWVILLCACTPPCWPIHLSSLTEASPTSWLLYTALPWTLRCTCLLKLWFSVVLHPGMGLLGPMVLLCLGFHDPLSCSPLWIYWLSFPPTVRRVLFLYYLSSIYCCRYSMLTILTCERWCRFWFTVL